MNTTAGVRRGSRPAGHGGRIPRMTALRPTLTLAMALVALVTLTMLASGCKSRRDPAAERVRVAREGTGDLVIAVAWPWERRQEIRYREGLQLAIDEVNAAGGIGGRKLRLMMYDDREAIGQGRLVAQQIADAPEVVAVIGHLQSYITVEAAPVYNQAGLVLVAPTATDPSLTEQGATRVFRICFTDRSVGRQLADFVAAKKWKRVAIYYIRSQYGRNVANAFESRASQLGLDVRTRSSYDPSEQASERSFEQVLTEWQAMELDAILLAGEVPSAAIFVAQARKHGIKAPIVGGDAMSSPGLMAVAGDAAEGVIVASFFHPDDPRPEATTFTKAFAAKYGFAPDAGSALGYDSVRLIAHAMHEAKSAVPDDVARAMHALSAWRGVTGTFTFDKNGDVTDKAVTLAIVRDGKFTFLAAPPSGPAVSTGGTPAGAPGVAPGATPGATARSTPGR